MLKKIILALIILGISSNVSAAGRLRALCTSEDGTKYFTQILSQDCLMNVLNDGWENFSIKPAYIVDVMPNKIVRESDGAKIWTQFFLAQPAMSEDGKWSYDYVKSVSKFYCDKKQTVLIQATYVLSGQRVYERLAPESIVEEIEPGTINEDIYKYVCIK